MKKTVTGIAFGAIAPLLLAQSATNQSQTTTTETTTQATADNSVTGEVVRYEAGQTIAIRQADGQTSTFTLKPDGNVPAEVAVGKTVTISTHADDAGSVTVTRVVIAASPSTGGSGSTMTSTTTESPSQSSYSSQTSTQTSSRSETAPAGGSTVSGDVVRYEAGKTIVLRSASGQETSYTLSSSTQAPGEVRVGKKVSLVTESSPSGTALVTRITTDSVLPDGSRKTTTETTYRKASGEAGSVTPVAGTISAYEPGRSITVVMPDKSVAVYSIDKESELPSDVAVGKQVTIQTRTVTTGSSPVVRRVVYTTRTKTTKKSNSQ